MKTNLILSYLFLIVIITNAQEIKSIKANKNTQAFVSKRHDTKSIQSIIWADDFSNPSNWTFSSINNKNWVIGTNGPAGCICPSINSTTKSNGFAKFDSDFFCNGNQIANISTANSINLTGHIYIQLTFQELYQRWYDSTFVFVTTDNWNTSVKFRVHNGWHNDQQTNNPETTSVNISSAIIENPSNVKIRFQFYSPSSLGVNAGCAYWWMIDDVAIVDLPTNDIQLTETFLDFSSTGYYERIPISQVGPITFKGIAYNFGGNTQTNVSMNIDGNNGAFWGNTGINNPIASFNSGSNDTLQVNITPIIISPIRVGTKLLLTQNETDEFPENNFDSIYFNYDLNKYLRTQNLLSLVSSYSFGTSAPAVSGMEYGANYYFTANGQIDSICAIIYKSNGSGTIIGKVYVMNTSTKSYSLVAHTNPYLPVSSTEMQNIALQTPLNVSSGTILKVTIQLNIAVGIDTIKIGCDNNFPGNISVAGSAWLQVNGIFNWYNFGEVPIVGFVLHNSLVSEKNNSSLTFLQQIIYPNPSDEIVNINADKLIYAKIYNSYGDLVYTSNDINLNKIAIKQKGIYLVELKTENNIFYRKIVIN